MTTTAPAPVATPTGPAHPEPAPRRRRRRTTPGRVLGWVVLALLLVVTLFPFYWMLRTALSTNAALPGGAADPLPVGFSGEGFRRALGLATAQESLADGGSGASMDFPRYLLNSVVVATLVTVCQVFFSAMAAYAFARLRWPGRDAVYAVFLAGLMVPTIFTLLPNFLLVRDLGLLDTLPGIALPTMLMTPFAVFFLRQFFAGISFEIEEAAKLDGAGRFRTFFTIVLPMASPAVVTLAVLTYITAWNDYLWPLLVSQSDDSRVLTLALGIFRAQSPQASPDWAGLMAATLLAALPMLLLFLAFAKRIVNSIGFTGIK
ncbi:carbohydrate ABC transporter membrane protein 2, CUT1 family [Cellulosimicrobium aquatile]|uniref:Carbohydrate ABC transporter membrane protein 2, CUT1 family n=1 Tax=Cellulosimicrobium aquatile TaxID=1612203 RepID=A0A1N6P1C0_9MICO|nr:MULTISPECIES: carbohydrate ABC transporter permease [Cellulosimicrobium]NMF29217.1 carbohydrate ABC transporter permease [Cellulosimicrobium aquatile]UTT59466.1 carbohydrate ABC transporter permease [Cellulosimicrobium cellulans]CPU63780.1 sugar ABC transporter [Mycobacteroides abscessus]SIP98188.1 carbohydrate ABC transporter membrane protein 2, CUT1 family [Cellulosimicrobium aquatile]